MQPTLYKLTYRFEFEKLPVKCVFYTNAKNVTESLGQLQAHLGILVTKNLSGVSVERYDDDKKAFGCVLGCGRLVEAWMEYVESV